MQNYQLVHVTRDVTIWVHLFPSTETVQTLTCGQNVNARVSQKILDCVLRIDFCDALHRATVWDVRAGGFNSQLRLMCTLRISLCAPLCSATSAFMRTGIKNSGCLGPSNASQSCCSPMNVSIDVRICLLIPVVKLVATPVLLITFISQENVLESAHSKL